jgi:hypothetical protein
VNQSLAAIAIIETQVRVHESQAHRDVPDTARKQAAALSLMDTVLEEDWPQAESLRKRLSGEKSASLRVSWSGKDRGIIDVEVWQSDGLSGQSVVLSMMMDITERVRIEREPEAARQAAEDSTYDALTGLQPSLLEEALGRESIWPRERAIRLARHG